MEQDLWKRLENVLSDKIGADYANIATNRLRESQAVNPRATLSDFGFGPQHGLNVVSSPDMYFPQKFKENTKLENLGYSTGGEFSVLGGVKLNPSSLFDPTASATHEAQHWKDWSFPTQTRLNSNYVGKETAQANYDSDKQILNNITKKLAEYRWDNNRNLRNRKILSGQEDSDEIVPQLRSYESMLPAGMSIFQSPLGKVLFDTPEKKLWYINKTQPSMSDQSQLDEIMERIKKAQK